MTLPPAPRRADFATAALVVLLPIVLFRDAVLGGAVLYERDVHLLWHPQIEGFVRAVAGGAWPTWDPWIGFGQPMMANANTQACYPPTWLNLVMRPWTYYTLYAAGHLAWAGLGMYAMARAFDVSRTGARVAAALWMASGPLLSLVSMWNHFGGAAWMPWVVAAARRLADRPDGPRAAALGVALALQMLAGSPDLSAYTGVVVAVVLLAAMAADRKDGARVRRQVAGGAAALAVAAALSAVQWMPTLDAVRGSPRWHLPDATRTYWSLHPLGAIELLWPRPWAMAPLSTAGKAALHESREAFLPSLYVGLPALGLVAAALRARRRHAVFLAAVGGAAVLAALGRHTVFFDSLVAVAPVLGLSRFPVKALPVAALAWAALAGIGVGRLAGRGAARIRRRRRRRRRRARGQRRVRDGAAGVDDDAGGPARRCPCRRRPRARDRRAGGRARRAARARARPGHRRGRPGRARDRRRPPPCEPHRARRPLPPPAAGGRCGRRRLARVRAGPAGLGGGRPRNGVGAWPGGPKAGRWGRPSPSRSR